MVVIAIQLKHVNLVYVVKVKVEPLRYYTHLRLQSFQLLTFLQVSMISLGNHPQPLPFIIYLKKRREEVGSLLDQILLG